MQSSGTSSRLIAGLTHSQQCQLPSRYLSANYWSATAMPWTAPRWHLLKLGALFAWCGRGGVPCVCCVCCALCSCFASFGG